MNGVKIGTCKFHMNTIKKTETYGSLLKGCMLLRIIAGFQDLKNHGVIQRTRINVGKDAKFPCVIVCIIKTVHKCEVVIHKVYPVGHCLESYGSPHDAKK